MMNDEYQAKYKESLNPLYKGNSLIECLPDYLEHEKFYDFLTKNKPVSREKALKYSIYQRDEFLSILKQTFFVPLERHYNLYRTIHNSLFSGYHLRNPVKKEVNLKLKSNYSLLTIPTAFSEATLSLSFSLIGISGVGKTTGTNRILSIYPDYVKHNSLELDPFYQIPFVKLECPKDSSIKDLCLNFFEKLDIQIGSNYQALYGKQKATESDMVLAMAKLTISHQIGMLIIDEIQNLTNSKATNSNKLLNFFVNLNNKLKIPIFIIGTPEIIDLLSKNYRLPRRWSGEGAQKWNIMRFDNEWKSIVEALFQYQYTDEAVVYDESWASLFYYHSQGIIDRTVRIFIEAQKLVLFSKEKKLSEQIVEKTIKEKFWLEEDAMIALRSGKEKDLSNYPDLFIPQHENESHVRSDYKELNVKKILKENYIPVNFYSSMLPNLLQNHQGKDIQHIALEIITEYNKRNIANPSRTSTRKPSKLIKNCIEGDLRKCYDEDIENLHKKLLDNDSLMNIREHFLEDVS